MIRTLIADDHPVVLEGLAALLSGTRFEVVARCPGGAQAMDALGQADPLPDLFVLDLHMPPPDGLDVLRALHGLGRARAAVLLTSSLAPEQLAQVMALGVGGVVLKESAATQLLRCLDAVAAGDRWVDPELALSLAAWTSPGTTGWPAGLGLSAREQDVLRLAATGQRNKQIGRELGLTEGTVKMYLHAIYQKLGVSNRMEMVNAARERGALRS